MLIYSHCCTLTELDNGRNTDGDGDVAKRQQINKINENQRYL